MRDMMANPERLNDAQDTRESVRKAAVAAYEALPAILLTAALLAPAIAALAARNAVPAEFDRQAIEARTGITIPEQGNQALIQIREESRQSLNESIRKNLLPKLS